MITIGQLVTRLNLSSRLRPKEPYKLPPPVDIAKKMESHNESLSRIPVRKRKLNRELLLNKLYETIFVWVWTFTVLSAVGEILKDKREALINLWLRIAERMRRAMWK